MHARYIALSLTLLVLTLACGGSSPSDGTDADHDTADPTVDGSGEPDAAEDTTADGGTDAPFSLGGRFTLEIDPAVRGVTLARDDEALLTFSGDALSLGVVARLDDNKSYDPVGFALTDDPLHTRPPLDHWTALAGIAVNSRSADSAVLGLTFDDGRSASLTVTLSDAGHFSMSLSVDEPDDPENGAVAYVRLHPVVDPEEAFYGLGEVFDDVNHRGHVRPMQLEVAESESGYNEAHVPVPLLVGTRGWGLFVESFSPGVFDVAAADPNRVDVIFGTGVFTADGLRFHLYAADHPLDITRHYYETTGYPARPARWALGPWIWRDENDDQAQVVSDVNTIRDLDLATSAYWIDRPYASGVNSFDFRAGQFPDPDAMIAEMHDLGFRVALWHTPYVDDTDPATEALRTAAEEGGFYPPRMGILFNHWGRPVDLTNPEAFAWWQSLIGRYTEMGIEGFKLDYGEDIVAGLFGGRSFWSFADGSDDRTMHARFQLFYHRAYAEMLPEAGGFLLCRGGTWGDQVNASVIWPGDLDADFSLHGAEVPDGDGTRVAVGGLPAALVASLSLGPSGYPLFGSDTGGYRHSPPDKETFTRWFEITALSPVMQVGTSTNDVAWEFRDSNGFDEEMLGWYRRYARLHLRLFPYFWTLFEQVYLDGRPPQRALGLAHPELGVHPNDTFLVGESLHVAPIVERGARAREVWYPEGEWYDWWTGEQRTGPGSFPVDAPLGTLPLSIRGGAVVPMLRPTIDTMSPTTAPDRVDSYATTPGRLFVVATPGPETALTLYDGTRVGQHTEDASTALWFAAGDEFAYGVRFEFLVGARPGRVTLDGEPLTELGIEAFDAGTEGWAWAGDERGGVLRLQTDGSDPRFVVFPE